jgi:hypothetical protein
MQEEEISWKDLCVGAAGAMPLFLPLEMVGYTGPAIVLGLLSGIASYVYADEIRDFAQKTLPQLQKMDVQQVKDWLQSPTGTPFSAIPHSEVRSLNTESTVSIQQIPIPNLVKPIQAPKGIESFPISTPKVSRHPVKPLDPQMQALVRRLMDDTSNEDDPNGSFTGIDEMVPVIEKAPFFPIYEDNVTLRLGKVVSTGARFDPHFNKLIGEGFIATAVQGSGKSQLCGLILEQADKCGVPSIVFDHKGEYKSLKDLPGTHAIIAGKKGNAYTEFALTTENAYSLVEMMMGKRCRVIVNLPSYGANSWLAKAEIVAAVAQALMAYAENQRQAGEKLLPCLVFLDEAQLYLPQDSSLLPPEATEKDNKEVLLSLKNSFFSLVSNGRSNGYTLFFATQTPTYIAKWAIKSCKVQVFGRQIEKNALDLYESIIDESVASRDEMRKLGQGVAIVYGFSDEPVIVQFDKKRARDESETPTLERLHEPQERHSEELPTIDLEKELMEILSGPDLYEEDECDTEPLEIVEEKQVKPEKQPLTPIIPDKGPRAEDIPPEVAVLLWNNGHNSEDKLMKCFPRMTKHQAGKLRDIILKQANLSVNE